MVSGESRLPIPQPVSGETLADVWLVGNGSEEERKYIGCCGLRAAHKEKAAHLAYYLARPYWGKGIASEVCTAFIDLAFTRLRLSRLLADVDQGNAVSRHILEKFGFNVVGRGEMASRGRVILLYELRAPGGEMPVGEKA
jgi:RimJ/RimL family protein N-acetyltransferase